MHKDYCTTETLNSILDGLDSRVILLDFRSKDDFVVNHIREAMNVQLTLHIKRKLTKGTSTVGEVLAGSCQPSGYITDLQEKLRILPIVLYDTNSDTLEGAVDSQNGSSIPIVFKQLSEAGCDVRLLKGGFNAFYARFPKHCELGDQPSSCSPTSDLSGGLRSLVLSRAHTTPAATPYGESLPSSPPKFDVSGFPVAVLPFLYLGNAENALDWDCLRKHHIRHVLNVTRDVESKFKDEGIRYLQLRIDDNGSEDMLSHFSQAIDFIKTSVDKQEGVLVHCLAGISRSVTIVIAYLMKTNRYSFNYAFEYVQSKRKNISPNFTFLNQLKDFEKIIQAESPTEMLQTAVVRPATDAGAVDASALLGASEMHAYTPVGHATGAFSCTPSSGASSTSSATDCTQQFLYQGFDKAAKFS